MTRSLTLAIIVSTSTLGFAAPKPALGQLVMDNHDGGHVTYADKCSNGRNSDDANRLKYVAALVADKASKLATTMAELDKPLDHQFMEVALTDWTKTFNLRDGCGEYSMSFSAMIVLRSKMGNSHELSTRFLVTIDDDVEQDIRTFKLRSIQPLTLRDQP